MMFSSSTRLVEDLSGFLSHVEVAGAVRAVTTNAVLFVQAVRQGVEIGFFRHGLMERRIEYSHVFVFQVREGFQRFSDADQVCRVVQRCERRGVFNTLNYGLVDHHGAGVFFTAVYDTVADCGQLSRQFWFCARIVLTIKFSASLCAAPAPNSASCLLPSIFHFDTGFRQVEAFR